MAQPRIPANRVPGVTALENVHGIQPTSSQATNNHGQPLGVTTFSTARVTKYNAGSMNFQTPVMVVQSPPGVAQHSPGVVNPQTVPGDPQTHPMYASNQPRGNMSSGSFLTFDPNKFISKQTRALGVIQILLGLIHIFSAINPWWYTKPSSPTGLSGYLIWGGISFIISGSLSVYVVKDPSPCVVHGSIGMNVVSAILSLIGICIVITEPFVVSVHSSILCTIILPFALLEFCLTCVVSHLGCQAECWNKYVNMTPVPVTVSVNTATNPASTTSNPATTVSPASPTYDNCAP